MITAVEFFMQISIISKDNESFRDKRWDIREFFLLWRSFGIYDCDFSVSLGITRRWIAELIFVIIERRYTFFSFFFSENMKISFIGGEKSPHNYF